MPRKPRIEYDGATYHVMCRGNRQQDIFRDARDNEMFLETLGEASVRCGWRVYAYVLMVNHYHLLLETPSGNLVAGMQWLQGTYTKRFNVRHKEWGHLFQGRYKALLVKQEGDYFQTVADYIHLNPARVKGYDFERESLEAYQWSSYPGYFRLKDRRDLLCVDNVLGALGLSDTPQGRRQYRTYINQRILKVQRSPEPWRANEDWDRIRRGWCFGDDAFRGEMTERLWGVLQTKRRDSFSGDEMTLHDESAAERWIDEGMRALGIADDDLGGLLKSSPEKYALAWLVRKHTCVRNGWIKKRLQMGTATNFSDYLRRIESAKPGGWGYEAFARIKNIIL